MQKSGLEGIRAFLGTLQTKKNDKNQKSTSKLQGKNIDKVPDQQPTENQQSKEVVPPVNNPLLAVISFLDCLTYSYEDGRILITKSKVQTDCKFQFLLLKPSQHFKDIVNEG